MFEPSAAVRQLFVDGILRAMNGSGVEGSLYGWHLTKLFHLGVDTVMEFTTGTPLIGYAPDQPRIEGPHQVTVRIEGRGIPG